MRTTIIAIGLCLGACEQDAGHQRAAAPVVAPAPTPPPRIEPAKPAIGLPRETAPPTPAVDPDAPPTTGPEDYAAWWRGRSKAEQRRITGLCREDPTGYQAICGGIGPLHIPYPPFPRAMERQASDPPMWFATEAAWRHALTAKQLAYIARHCVGGEGRESSALCGDNTPLVVAFDRQPIEFARGGTFAFQAGDPVASDLPTAATPWLARDVDHDGAIDRGAELFGSDTVVPGGGTAVNGFVALAALDANHDGLIDARDPDFASLVLWADRDGNGRSTADELTPVASVIVSISLANHLVPRCDARDNCEGERSTITWRDAAGALHDGSIVDVYLPRR